uniref:LID domain-containing protein n=1 Tax=Heterorhabditis bacteriophora TaxID=37862 RepID=A0A1I7WWZ8_HETBA
MGDTTVTMGNGGMVPTSMGETGQLAGMLNGEDLKQSPASTPRGINGGTPAPGSVQSGQPASVAPTAESLDHPNQQPSKVDDINSEISKIKMGLMDDFAPKEEISSGDQSSYF